MTTDLDEALRRTGADLHLDRPVGDVLARGERLRRRRRTAREIAVTAVLVAACGGGALLVAPAGEPTVSAPTATASATPVPGGDHAPDLDAVRACRDTALDLGVPAGTEPALTDSDAGRTLLVYRFATDYAWCATEPVSDGRDQATGGERNPYAPLTPGRAFKLGVADAAAAFWVAPEVDRLVLHLDGTDVEASVHDGMAVVWLPASAELPDVLSASATAYAGDGSVLQEGPAR